MECDNKCGKELVGKQKRFCSDRCRKQSLRAAMARLKSDTNSDKIQPGQANSDKPLIENFGQPDCQCQMCKTNRVNGNKHIINHGEWQQAGKLRPNELNRVTLPGDLDYTSKCKATASYDTGVGQIHTTATVSGLTLRLGLI